MGTQAQIKAISTYLPERVLTNAELSERFDLKEATIFRQTGVKQRHISAPTEIGSDVGLKAAQQFLTDYPEAQSQIDFLIFCTEYPDHCAPHTAARLQHDLGLSTSCGTMDMPMGCTGFMYGLMLAKSLVEAGTAQNVMVITAETPSKVIHPDDRDLIQLFGDAGACTLIGASESGSVGQFVYGTDGAGYEKLIVRGSGSRETTTKEWLETYENVGGLPWGRMQMNGPEIFTFALTEVPKLHDELLEKNDLTRDDIDLYVFHQANGFLLKVLCKKLRIPDEKFFIYMEDTGNTVSSTIPIALQGAIRAGKAGPGKRIMLVSFGIGLSWAGTVVQL